MQTRDTNNLHRFLDYNEGDSLINQFYRLAQEDQDKAREFLKAHSRLTDEKMDRIFELLNGDDPDEQESLGILTSEEANFHRTTEEIIEAYQQVWDRIWYGRSHNSEPVSLPGITELEMVFDDIQDPKYYEPWGWGYLSGVMSALNWVLGESWAMLDT